MAGELYLLAGFRPVTEIYLKEGFFVSKRKIKDRSITRKNAKMGKRLRAEIRKKGLSFRNEYDVLDPTAAIAFQNIARWRSNGTTV